MFYLFLLQLLTASYPSGLSGPNATRLVELASSHGIGSWFATPRPWAGSAGTSTRRGRARGPGAQGPGTPPGDTSSSMHLRLSGVSLTYL